MRGLERLAPALTEEEVLRGRQVWIAGVAGELDIGQRLIERHQAWVVSFFIWSLLLKEFSGHRVWVAWILGSARGGVKRGVDRAVRIFG